MVIVIAIALTVVAVQLKPQQQYNERVEKMQNILTSVNIESTPQNAETLFKKYFTSSLVVNNKGEEITGKNAFDISLAFELKNLPEKRNLPVFICKTDNNETFYSVPIRGKGLWGPVWGYVAFKDDLNTIIGTQFAHKSETPGLGAEIDTREFQALFIGKSIFDDKNEFVSISIIKGGAPDSDKHGIDAISGGTITSKGLEKSIKDCLVEYVNYFKKAKKQEPKS